LNRLLAVSLAVASLLTSTSCGNIFVRGAINPGAQSANGTVSVVEFSASSGSGVSVTIITLTSDGMGNTLRFCGDQTTLFPLDNQVQVNFMPGSPCASVISVNLM
jgi:hypothetical protein